MFTNLFAPHHNKMWTEQFSCLAVKFFGTLAPGKGFFNIENWRNYQGRSDYTINYRARSMLSCLGGREGWRRKWWIALHSMSVGHFWKHCLSWTNKCNNLLDVHHLWTRHSIFQGRTQQLHTRVMHNFPHHPPCSKKRIYWHLSKTWQYWHILLRKSLWLNWPLTRIFCIMLITVHFLCLAVKYLLCIVTTECGASLPHSNHDREYMSLNSIAPMVATISQGKVRCAYVCWRRVKFWYYKCSDIENTQMKGAESCKWSVSARPDLYHISNDI